MSQYANREALLRAINSTKTSLDAKRLRRMLRCHSKTAYPTEQMAQDSNKGQTPYFCHGCNYWHLTKWGNWKNEQLGEQANDN